MSKNYGQAEMKKVLNTFDVIMVAFGAMIGWGWVVSSGQWIQQGGVGGTVIGFIIGGVMIYFVGLTYAELTSAMPNCGGEQVFGYKAFGNIGAFVCAWAIILSYIGVVCYEAVSLPTIVQYLFPGFMKGYLYSVAGFDIYASWLIIAVLFSAIIVWVNIQGTKSAALFQNVLTIMIAAVGIILTAGAVLFGSPDNLQGQVIYGNDSMAVISNIFRVAIMTPFFFFGFDVIPHAAEEINVPRKKLGKLMMLSIVLAVLFYVMVVISVGYVMSPFDIAASMETTGLVTADAMAKAFGSKAMAKVLIIGGMCGIITSWNSFMIGGSRSLFSLARSYMIPTSFARLHPKHKTPVNALLLIGILSVLAPFFGRAMLVWIVDAGNFACCLAYCMVSASFLVIRKKYPQMVRPYKVKNHLFVGVVALGMSGSMAMMYIIPGTNCSLLWQEWIIVGGWILLGMIFYASSKMKYKELFGTNIHE